ncbi:cell division topological specificity factor homolog, chloroplastic-like [Impatiens glandulifera]|uniref:cell division topological specificity factor homolog, chloroplastic-like n=1 Tax=Impatiens glandulifera TaxID=253017 RepID=UPI001FB199EC|nr:cell division topological specificity factor homolog, chloroplastic-like [Impatiens glandulifera]
MAGIASGGDLTVVSATFGSYRSVRSSFPPSPSRGRVDFVAGRVLLKWCSSELINCHCNPKRPSYAQFAKYDHFTHNNDDDDDDEDEDESNERFLLSAVVNMKFLDRLSLAWKIVFPTTTTTTTQRSMRKSNAKIAKQRLKMILFSDRCAVSEEAKQKIVNNVVNALSDFVVIESQDKVQLNVSTDGSLGTIYSVTIPVRRVKSEFQEEEEEVVETNIKHKDDDGERRIEDSNLNAS